MKPPVDYDPQLELDQHIKRILQQERRLNRILLSVSISVLGLGILLGVIYVLRA